MIKHMIKHFASAKSLRSELCFPNLPTRLIQDLGTYTGSQASTWGGGCMLTHRVWVPKSGFLGQSGKWQSTVLLQILLEWSGAATQSLANTDGVSKLTPPPFHFHQTLKKEESMEGSKLTLECRGEDPELLRGNILDGLAPSSVQLLKGWDYKHVLTCQASAAFYLSPLKNSLCRLR